MKQLDISYIVWSDMDRSLRNAKDFYEQEELLSLGRRLNKPIMVRCASTVSEGLFVLETLRRGMDTFWYHVGSWYWTVNHGSHQGWGWGKSRNHRVNPGRNIKNSGGKKNVGSVPEVRRRAFGAKDVILQFLQNRKIFPLFYLFLFTYLY